MKEVFTWSPAPEVQGDAEFATSDATFGDGYTQSAAAGLNNCSDTWPLTFTGREQKIKPIRDFLKWHGGYKSFYWTPPLGEPGLYQCKKFSLVPHGVGAYTLIAEFKQVFSP